MPTLRRGDFNESAIADAQQYLKQAGFYKGEIDGLFGPGTEAAVIAFQQKNNLIDDGIIGQRTWRRLMRQPAPSDAAGKELTTKCLRQAAATLDIPVEALKAFSEVESAGSGFLDDGRPVILFERHWFYRLLKKEKGASFAEKVRQEHGDICNPSPGGYRGGLGAWERFERAAQIDRDIAIQSCSWGRFQLMGFHWKVLGYPSPEVFYEKMSESEDWQLDGIVRFIKASPKLLKAIRSLDWSKVAHYYNGPNYAINKYDVKLEAAYERYLELA